MSATWLGNSCGVSVRRRQLVPAGEVLPTAAPIVPSAPVTRTRAGLLIGASTIAGALARQLAVSQRRHPVHEHVAHALGQEVRLEDRPALGEAPGSKTATSARAPSRRMPRSARPMRSAGWPVSRWTASSGESSRSSRTMKRQNHDAHVYAPWKNDSASLPFGREGRRVRARHAEPVRERLALLILGVGVDDHHQLVQLVDAGEQEVVDGVERLLAPVGGDRREVAAAVLRPDLVVEQDDARPVVAGAQDRAVAAHLVALRRVAQDRRELRRLGAERPGGQRRVEVRQAERARVHVERDVLPRVARGLDELDAAAALLDPVPRDEMRDLQPHLRLRAGADRLGDRVGGALVALARVRRVERRLPRQRRQLVLARRLLLRVLEPGRVAPRALVERLAQQHLHLGELSRVGRPVGEAERRQPQLAVRDEAEDVHRGPRGLERLEVLARGAPRDREIVGVAVDRAASLLRIADREAAEAAVADDLGRDALVDRADRTRIHEQRVVGVAVDVDEPRRDREPGRVDRSAARLERADRGDAAVLHADVGDATLGARAVVDRAAADHDVEAHARAACASARPSR